MWHVLCMMCGQRQCVSQAAWCSMFCAWCVAGGGAPAGLPGVACFVRGVCWATCVQMDQASAGCVCDRQQWACGPGVRDGSPVEDWRCSWTPMLACSFTSLHSSDLLLHGMASECMPSLQLAAQGVAYGALRTTAGGGGRRCCC